MDRQSMKAQTKIVVKKFGGTSVGSVEKIENVASRILEDVAQGQKPIIVASAMAGETNRLVDLAHKMNGKYHGPAYDMLLASGEQVSVALLVMAFAKRGQKAKAFLAHQLGIYTDSVVSQARIQSINIEPLKSCLDEGVIPVIAGFQGVDKNRNITTLGRGGTDTSAMAIAVAMKLDECEIYTDVASVFSADPHLVYRAKEIETLSYQEMMEMASVGSKVLHIRSVELGAKYGVKIHVRSSFEKRKGTWIIPEGESMEKPVVSAVTHEADIAVIKLFPMERGSESLAYLFEQLSEKGIVVDVITQSYNEEGQRLAFSLSKDDVYLATEIIQKIFPTTTIKVLDGVSKVSIVGVGMKNHPGVAAKFFRTLSDKKIDVEIVTTSEIKVSAIINHEQLSTAAQALHTEFGLDVS